MSLEPQESVPGSDFEDRERAGLYALLSRFYYDGPDAALLRSVAGMGAAAGDPYDSAATALAAALQSLCAAAASADASEVSQEYDQIFVGTGKAEVTPYASHYLAEAGREKILVRLRQTLADLGLARRESSREPEDHVAALFDVMRYLALAGMGDAALQKQQSFFSDFIAPFYPRFCAAVAASERTRFYRCVAALTLVFLDIERQALDMI